MCKSWSSFIRKNNRMELWALVHTANINAKLGSNFFLKVLFVRTIVTALVMYDSSGIVLLMLFFFCNPQNQVLYTIGGLENLIAARKYYAATIDLTGGKCTRALLGICLVRSPFILSHRFNPPRYPSWHQTEVIYLCETSADQRSHSSQEAGTKRTRTWLHKSLSLWLQLLWRKSTSKNLRPNSTSSRLL